MTTTRTMSSDYTAGVTFAANNGDVGGGEVMLLRMAEVANEAGHDVHVVGPNAEDGVVQQARERGLACTALAANRSDYMRELRSWDRGRNGLLWCNGLVPALATSGHRGRVIHLHQLPRGFHRPAGTVARLGALLTVVPSSFMAAKLHDTHVMENWSQPPGTPHGDLLDSLSVADRPTRIGYIGRLGIEKGVHLAGQAVQALRHQGHDLTFVVAGDSRFVDTPSQAAVWATLDALSPHVELLGWVAPDDFFPAVDVVVVPSVEPESFGLIVVEAMSMRRPVIITTAGALPEVVGPGHPWVAKAGSVTSLTEAIRSFLNTPREDVEAILDHGHARWLAQYAPPPGQTRFRSTLNHALTKNDRSR